MSENKVQSSVRVYENPNTEQWTEEKWVDGDVLKEIKQLRFDNQCFSTQHKADGETIKELSKRINSRTADCIGYVARIKELEAAVNQNRELYDQEIERSIKAEKLVAELEAKTK